MQVENKDFETRVLTVLDRRLSGQISSQEAVQNLRDLFRETNELETKIDQVIKRVSRRETKPFRIPELRLLDGTMAPEIDRALWRFWIDLGLGLSPYAKIGTDFIEAMGCNFSRPKQPFADL